MVEFRGIGFEKEEVEDFQKRFWGSLAAVAVNKLFVKATEVYTEALLALGSSETVVRQAQGALHVLGEVQELAAGLMSVDLEGKEEGLDEEKEDLPDVTGF